MADEIIASETPKYKNKSQIPSVILASDEIANKLLITPERLEQQASFIKAKLLKTTMFNKYKLDLTNSNQEIVESLGDALRNVILYFFRDLFRVKECEACKTTGVELERAHPRDVSRDNVALSALNRIRPDPSVPIKQSDFLRAFIDEHSTHIIWYLCAKCHKAYDRR